MDLDLGQALAQVLLFGAAGADGLGLRLCELGAQAHVLLLGRVEPRLQLGGPRITTGGGSVGWRALMQVQLVQLALFGRDDALQLDDLEIGRAARRESV